MQHLQGDFGAPWKSKAAEAALSVKQLSVSRRESVTGSARWGMILAGTEAHLAEMAEARRNAKMLLAAKAGDGPVASAMPAFFFTP